MKLILWFAVLLVGCGGSAEAGQVKKGDRILVRLATVDDAISWCDAHNAWQLVLAEWRRVVKGAVSLDLLYDQAHQMSGPELTVDTFWSGAIGDYWRGVIPPQPDSIRWVALPALEGKLYGGMHYGRGLLGSWFYTNTEPGNDCRNAFIFLHEFLHGFGVPDSCNGTRPNLMCAEDAPLYRDCKAPLRLDAIQERQVRRKLGLRAGKVLVIRGK